ncbi:PAS domain S-box protein [Trichothermofontia sichuanensis B231]|uniref:PAS domain S-box protein n=1 Tax=Trichothermofontia sichuanensis TaxID=3045816 RepID=UPI002246C399|nr:PAS domain S-box protein [Trichothermofontia sichuanensis]UZQ54913.1 PAS domain S-box protein [Trichothermofontia sichuanensis B231]
MPLNAPRYHILLIESRVEVQAQLRQMLSPPYHLTVVSKRPRALDIIDRCQPDLIIIELSLAEVNQFEWVKNIRQTSTTAKLPLLLLATEAAADICLKGLSAGATDYMIEPVSKAECLVRIKGAFDLEEQRKNITSEANSCQFLTMLLKKLPEAVVATDLDYHIIYLNKKAENLYGMPIDKVIGQPLKTLYQSHWLQPEDEAIAVKSLATIGEWYGENKHVCHDGQVLSIFTSVRVLRNQKQEPIGLVFVLRDITQLKCLELALKESELHLSHIAENIREAFWIMDFVRQKFVYVSPAYEQIFQLSRRSLYRHAWDWTRLVHPDDRHLLNQPLFLDKSWTESNYNACLEYRIIRADGSVRWIRDRRFPIQNALGQPYRIVGLIEDWTEQKQASQQIKAALAEKEVLLRELHHRVKNNLQIISGLLYLQSYHLNNPEITSILKASRDRIESMAHIHDQLCRSQNLSRIDLGRYIQTLARHLYSSLCASQDRINLLLKIDSIELNPNLAIYCGLIINELLSNSLKYAFPDQQTGTIGIHIYRESTQIIVLKIWDTGIGLPDDFNLNTCHSLGLPLVHQLVTAQLRGTIKQLSEPGTAFEIRFANGGTHSVNDYLLPIHSS